MEQKRNGMVDVFRLLYALVIMTGHSVTVGNPSPFPFEPVGILVEFFLFLTGYYTCQFFERNDTNSADYFSVSMKYTIKKFRSYTPYLVFSVGLSYSILMIEIYKSGGGYWTDLKDYVQYALRDVSIELCLC